MSLGPPSVCKQTHSANPFEKTVEFRSDCRPAALVGLLMVGCHHLDIRSEGRISPAFSIGRSEDPGYLLYHGVGLKLKRLTLLTNAKPMALNE